MSQAGIWDPSMFSFPMEAEVEDEALMYDPDYQSRLFLIESALQEVGILDRPNDPLPNIYDKRLMELIDSVPLE